MSSSVVDITESWRADNEMRRAECFVDQTDAAAYIRKVVDGVISNPRSKADLKEVHGLCKAIELDFFRLIGKTIKTNETPRDSVTGPKPKSGKLVAILSSGQGLVLVETLSKLKSLPGSGKKVPIRHGFVISYQKLSEFERKERKRRKKAG